MDQFFFWGQKSKNIDINVIPYIKISDFWTKKSFQKKIIAGGKPLCSLSP
jgi:hypothetical protein